MTRRSLDDHILYRNSINARAPFDRRASLALQRQSERADEKRKRDKERKRNERDGRIKYYRIQKIFCTVCGTQIHYKDEPPTIWSRRKKCDSCSENKVKAGQIKYCKYCGKPYRYDNFSRCYDAPHDPDRKYAKNAWAAWACCDNCKQVMPNLSKKLRKSSKETN